MIPNKKPNSPFIPLSAAISDTFLQIRTKPLIFLAVWLLLALPPQLLFVLVSPQRIAEMTETSYQVSGEMPGSGVMRNSTWAQSALLMLISLAILVYQYSVLADVIARLRKKLPPKFARSLSGGLRRFGSLLKVFLASGIRILIEPAVIAIPGTVITALLEKRVFIGVMFIVTLVMFIATLLMYFINLLRFGLAPYVHLSLGTGWRSALAVSKTYCRAHRLRVLVLFGFVILLLLVIFYPLNLVAITETMSIVLGVLQSIVMFFMGGVLINFGMNNFIPESSDEGGDDSRQVEAPS